MAQAPVETSDGSDRVMAPAITRPAVNNARGPESMFKPLGARALLTIIDDIDVFDVYLIASRRQKC